MNNKDEFFMVADRNGQYYINSCGRGDLIKSTPKDFFFSKCRSDNGKLSAEDALNRLSISQKRDKGFYIVMFKVDFVDKSDCWLSY